MALKNQLKFKKSCQKRSRNHTRQQAIAPLPKPAWATFARQTYIRSGRKIIPFEPFRYQKELAELLALHDRLLVAKTRQTGMTEFVANWLLWNAYNNPAYLAVIFSKTQDDSSDIAKRVRLMASSHPDIELDSKNTKDISLKNGGRLLFKPSTSNAARGIPSAHAILFDECAFVKNIEEIYGSALPATEMVENAKIVMLSTANGQSGLFWEYLSKDNEANILVECDRARREKTRWWLDKSGWVNYLLHYTAHPIYGKIPNYLERKRKELKLSLAQVEQEYNLNFTVTQGAIVDREWLNYYRILPSEFDLIVQSWDTAATDKKTSAYWACTTWGIKSGRYYLIDAYWKHHQYASGYRAVVSLAQKHCPHVVLIEEKSTGINLGQDLPRDRDFPSAIHLVQPTGNKVERFEAESLAIENGRLWLPTSAPWLPEVEAMLVDFPNCEILDVIDSISQFLMFARMRMGLRFVQQRAAWG